jgi:hypothetical protein
LEVPEIGHVIVSTDSPAIAEEARRHGADVPFLRPAELSRSETPMVEVLIHACNWYQSHFEMPEGMAVVVLQPTSPLRRLTHVRAAIALFEECRAKGDPVSAVQTVSEVPDRYRPERLYRLNENGTLTPGGLPSVEKVVYRNGAAIVLDPNALEALNVSRGRTFGLLVPEPLVSIDDWFDLVCAELQGLAALEA